MKTVTIEVALVDELYFYMHHPIKTWFLKKLSYLFHIAILSFSYSLKISCVLLRQVISLKKMVVLSVKCTILI